MTHERVAKSRHESGSTTPPEPTKGAYALSAPTTGRLSAIRARLRDVPGARATYRAGHRVVVELRLAVRGRISARRVRQDTEGRQRFTRQAERMIPWPAVDASMSVETLRHRLEADGLEVRSDQRFLYLPPQTGLREVIGETLWVYPPDAALAIPQKPLYAPAETADFEITFRHLLAANVLYSHGDGARVYDIIRLGEQRQIPGFIVSHTAHGQNASQTDEEKDALVTRLITAGQIDPLIDSEYGRPADVMSSPTSPHGDAGLLSDLGRLSSPPSEFLVQRLLDEQAISTLHFGRERLVGGNRYLYQSIPTTGQAGRRDSARRWKKISSMLADNELSVSNRLVLDVGCNAGMMLAAALTDGAAWGLGWDLPRVCEQAKTLLLGLGYTRFDLVGTTLDPSYRLEPNVPEHLLSRLDGSIVLYLAIRHHAGFVADLGAIPWQAMVYEGGETESVARLEEALAPLRQTADFTIASAMDFRDGEGLARPLAILIRR